MTETIQAEFDCGRAMREGWVILEAEGSLAEGRWQLQRLDEMERFDGDWAAWEFVIGLAVRGSTYHKAALCWIREHDAPEFERIARHSALMGFDLNSHL